MRPKLLTQISTKNARGRDKHASNFAGKLHICRINTLHRGETLRFLPDLGDAEPGLPARWEREHHRDVPAPGRLRAELPATKGEGHENVVPFKISVSFSSSVFHVSILAFFCRGRSRLRLPSFHAFLCWSNRPLNY